ncbi:acyl carrier protein [bacterium]|nr:acyl carrier protein [bacterium]
MTDIAERVRNIVAERLNVNPEEVTLETTFEDLGADSLDVMDLIMELEQEFDIEIPDEDAEKIRTIEDVINYIQTRIQNK